MFNINDPQIDIIPEETLPELHHRRIHSLQILKETLQAVDPFKAVCNTVKYDPISSILTVSDRTYNLTEYERVFVIGAGKAGSPMAGALAQVVHSKITGGAINVKYGHLSEASQLSTLKFNITEAGHPIPDEAGLQGTRQIMQILEQSTEKDLVIAVISGGGSALLELPVEGISLDDLQTLTQKLLRAGTNINQINTVRKHLSRVKGGNLAKLAYPSTLVNLILSDVVGSPLGVIASGPTVPDVTTYREAWNVLQHYGLTGPGELPESILNHLQKGIAGDVAETPKPGDRAFDKVQNVIVGDNRVAADAAARKALSLGYQPLILTTYLEGEAREVAKVLVAIAREVAIRDIPVRKPACIIAGGETTVTLRGEGKGGRNQELALAAALAIDGLHNILCVPLATDGTDGPTDAAGAVVDGYTVSRARDKGLDPVKYLVNNDAYNFFLNEGSLLVTGPTSTNVNDITLLLVW